MLRKIAVISDIHGNAPALEAVLQDIGLHGVERIVNLGDSLFGPVDPQGTAALLMERQELVNIMGNCDEHLLLPESSSLTYRQVRPLLGDAELSWIRSHRKTWSHQGLMLCHGTPWDNSSYLLEEVLPGGEVRVKPPEQLEQELHTIEEKIVCCGHSHVFRQVMLPGGRSVVNAGSVGLPAYEEEQPHYHVMESGTPQASYCLFTHSGTAAGWTAGQILVSYDWERAAWAAERNGREDYAVAIRTGRTRGAVR
ncbi:metallophosphoesterase family protein [Paenibacillus tepidiphilus]|uniref:metallophosphoesterase family protein n=1 Tax=Paenibacillus tepidiphilus TaxID=2608683 RepID=UPI00123A3D16|nr:metallophosphoesterase family protein [Paenibacillus tepidiphilus]